MLGLQQSLHLLHGVSNVRVRALRWEPHRNNPLGYVRQVKVEPVLRVPPPLLANQGPNPPHRTKPTPA